MALGRLLFGLGAESMIVAVTVAIGQWFIGNQLGFAFGLNLSIARAGFLWRRFVDQLVRARSTTWDGSRRLLIGRMAFGIALLGALVYYRLEGQRRADASTLGGRSHTRSSYGRTSGASTAPTGTSSASA